MLLHAFAGEVLDGSWSSRRCASRSSRASSPRWRATSARDWPMSTSPMSRRLSGKAARFDVAAKVARRLSDPVGARARQAAGLSRQREHQPEAAGGDRGDRRLLPSRQRQHSSRHAPAERAGDGAVRRRARKKAARSSTPPTPHTIVLTKGTTDGINLVAQSYGRPMLKPGDEIVLSWLEHHSNIVPWQLVGEQTGAAIKVVPINDLGEIDQDAYDAAVVAHEDRRRRPRLERARHDQPDQGDDRAGARGRRGGARRRRAGRAAPADRRAGSRLRLLRAVEPQDVRPDRHRRALRPQARCSRRCRRIRAAAT